MVAYAAKVVPGKEAWTLSDVPTGLQFVETPVPTKFNVLLYGPAKAGKSTAAATAEGPILWVNFQGEGALGFPKKIAAQRGTVIHEVRVPKEQDPREVLREVVKHVRSGAEPRVRTIVVDTVGNLRDRLIRLLVQKNTRNSLQQYGEVADILLDVLLTLRDQPTHLVLVCHEDIKDGEGDEPRIVQPLVGGKTTGEVLAEVDVIAYCGAVQTEDGTRYMAQLVEARGRRAGDRSGGLGAWRELDLAEWWGVYRDALTPVTSDLPWDESGIEAVSPAGAEQATDGSAPQSSQAVPPPAAEPPGVLPDTGGKDFPEETIVERILEEFPGSEAVDIDRPELDPRTVEMLDHLVAGAGLTGAAKEMGLSEDGIKALAKTCAKTLGVRPTVTGLLMGYEAWRGLARV